MSLRIIGGEYKGIFLNSPKGAQTRPTSSLLRKAVFDMCQFIIQDANFLDLFAGSGAMGLEALSRGAQQAVFVDEHKLAILCIKENIAKLQVAEYATVLALSVTKALAELTKKKQRFDIIYIDPPYKLATQELFSSILTNVDLWNDDALIFCEEGQDLTFELSSYPHLHYENKRRFGDSYLHRFRVKLG